MANQSHKSRQQKSNVAARKKKAQEMEKAAKVTADIKRKMRQSDSHHRNNRLYNNLAARMMRPTLEQMEAQERMLCQMFGEEYRP